MKEPNRCPFCGGAPIVEKEYLVGHWIYNVRCDGCYGSGPRCNTKGRAIELWNRRVMSTYIVEYRYFDKMQNTWIAKLSQDAYRTLEDAQRFIESRPGNPCKCSQRYYQTERLEEYYIHDFPSPK